MIVPGVVVDVASVQTLGAFGMLPASVARARTDGYARQPACRMGALMYSCLAQSARGLKVLRPRLPANADWIHSRRS